MKEVIMLTISGGTYFFEDNDFTVGKKVVLQEIANDTETKGMNESEILKNFLNTVKNELDINLLEVKISYVLRINS